MPRDVEETSIDADEASPATAPSATDRPSQDADDRPQAKQTALTPRDILERAARAKQMARQRLGELARDSRDVDIRLRQIDGEDRFHNRDSSKRARDDESEDSRTPKKRAPAEEVNTSGDNSGAAVSTAGANAENDTSNNAIAGDDAMPESEPPKGEGDQANGVHEPTDAGDTADTSATAMAIETSDSKADPEPADASEMDTLTVETSNKKMRDGPSSAERGRPLSSRSRPSPRLQNDNNTQQRNKKMFSLLRGTLVRAREEQHVSRDKSLSLQQQKLEKVETKLKSDRSKLLEFQRSFISTQKESIVKRKKAITRERSALDERLMTITRDTHILALSSFIKTVSDPPIYYLPKSHNDSTRALLRQQQQAVRLQLADSPIMETDPLALQLDTEPAAEAPASAMQTDQPEPEAASVSAPGDEAGEDIAESAEILPEATGVSETIEDGTSDGVEAAKAPAAELDPIEEPVALDLS
eukprot:CAMPEP_0119322336 /NCGR_PEP_ID=MMETSP1333-20130426/57885_1 /TAXON_ID=418940 /ORGANISM="Scyphosphaera apsteinii, Strain RCC1455" /LENGTH=472 /DNA_ID=CAMNT_0007329535 /DNA_START=15 /DNA_END=1433 /DNA_ORIENTATION=+